MGGFILNKKYITGLALAAILTMNTVSAFAETPDNATLTEEPQNELTMVVDYDTNEYKIIKDGEVIERGSSSPSATLNTDAYYTVTAFTSIDTGKLTVTSNRNNPGRVAVRAVKDGKTHYSIPELSPGTSWTTAGGLSAFTKYTITSKALQTKGTYSFTLKW